MGFWDVTKRLLQGKPAFEVPGSPQKGKAVDEWGDPVQDPDPVTSDDSESGERIHRNQRVNSQGYKIVPEAEIIRVEPRYSGDAVELWVTIRNQSQYPVFLDKSYVFGVKQELDYPLPAGGQREFSIYRGKQLMNDGYKYAELYYRDDGSGDYFCATHMIVYDHRSDGTYEVDDLKLVRPIKDV